MKSSDSEKKKLKAKACYVPNNNDQVDVPTDNTINPFDNDVMKKLSYFDIIQIVIMSLTIAPIRVVMLLTSFLILWPIGAILASGISEEDRTRPLKGWRKTFLPVAAFFSRCVFFSAGYHWITITGDLDPKAPILVFAPHSSFFDAMLITYLNFVSVIGRKGTDKITLFGHLTRLCQPIIVERENKESREAAVRKIQERVTSNLDWPPLSIFVEGTTSNGKVLIKFKTGAFKPGVPVQPVCFKYNKRIFDSSSWTWDGPHWFVQSWLALCQIHSPIEFIFLPIYYPDDREKACPEYFAENIRRRMAQCLDIPITDFSYEDAKVGRVAQQYGLPYFSGLIDIFDMKKKTGIKNVEEFYTCFPLFAKIADPKTGLCFCDQFAKGLGFYNNNEHIYRFFNMFAKEKNGNFNLRMFTEFYFINIYNHTNELLEKVLNSFDKFNSSTGDNRYSVLEFKMFVKNTYDLEFLNLDFLDAKETIDKETLTQYFKENVLALYLFAIISKKS